MDKKLSQALTTTTSSNNDEIYIVSNGTSYAISKGNFIGDRVDNLEENQMTGVEVYQTLADLPATGTANVSYKVANDPTSSNNGYYAWTGSAYVKDAGLANGDVAEGETEAVSGDTVYDAINITLSNQIQQQKTRYNFISEYNEDLTLFETDTDLTLIDNTLFLGAYPKIYKYDKTGEASGIYDNDFNLGGFTNNRILNYACSFADQANPTYFTLRLRFYDYAATSTAVDITVRNTNIETDVLQDDAYLTATVYKKESDVFYIKVVFKQDQIFDSQRIRYGSYSTSKIAYFGNFSLIDATDTTDEQLLYYQDDSVENPYLVDSQINYEEIKNKFFDDSGLVTVTDLTDSSTDYNRGFKDNGSAYSSEVTTDLDYLEGRLVYKYSGLPVTTTFDLVQNQYDTFPLEVVPTTCNIGFWVDVTNLDDAFKISTTGANFVWLYKIGLGERETVDYYLGITDRVKTDTGDWYYINFRNKNQISTEIEIGNLSSNITTTDISIGGFTYTDSDYKLSGRVNYKTIAEDETDLVGKSCAFVGDSTIQGTVLIRRFAQLTGVSTIYMAAENGANIGNSSATYWIYDYRDWIITQEPDFVVYGISSNDISNTTGTSADVDDAGVTNSFYKYYFQFMRYILSNTSAITGSAVTNLEDKGHFMCTWFTRNDGVQPTQRESSIEKNAVVDEIARYWGCSLIDIHRSVGWRVENSTTYSDGVHPQELTHNKAANLIKHHVNIYYK